MTGKTVNTSPPFTALGLDHVVFKVADMDRAIAFWRDVIGAREERRIEEIGLVQMRAGTSLIDLAPADEPHGGQNVEHVCIEITPWDEEALRAHLAAHEVEAGKSEIRYGAHGFGPSIYLEDPDGNMIELKGPGDGDGRK
jgi:catechol 2,3-dioxygenase-like lactoylglutathione lyase family enzyme